MLRALARAGARSALEDYCRSYVDERGDRPSAVQAYEAGYNPASARQGTATGSASSTTWTS